MARFKVLHHPKDPTAFNAFCIDADSAREARAKARILIPDIQILSVTKI